MRSLAGTDADYELLIVDDYQGRSDRNVVRDYARELEIPLTWHGPSKAKSYSTYQGLLNAMNTACVHARGSHVLFCHDFMKLPYYAIHEWKKALSEPGDYLLHGAANVVSVGRDVPPSVVSDLKTWNHEPHLTFIHKWDWTPTEFELFYFACPISYVEQINGFDERGDHSGLLILDSVITQAKLNNYQLKVNPALRCSMIDHRVWGPPGEGLEVGQWRIPGETCSSDKKWEWQAVSPNPFNLKEMRK